MGPDRGIAEYAARQYGAFSAAQAATCGLSRRTLARRLEAGRIVVLQRGVYAVSGAPAGWERSVMAACLAAGPDAVASHRSAARLWGLSGGCGDDTVEITVPRPRSPRPRRIVLHRSTDLVPDHTTVRHRLPVTKPARTVVDLGAVLSPDEVEDALDRGLAARLFTVAGIEWMRNEVSRQGRHGAGVIRGILDARALGAAPPDGLLEPRMARLLREAGLPAAEFQYVIRTPEGLFVARVDFAYPEVLLAMEVDGYLVHGSPRAMEKDFVRSNGLVALGWHVLRFTWHQVVRHPGAVAAAVAAALDVRRAG